MSKLLTIQKRENLNEIYVADKKGNGGANHKYQIDRIIMLNGNRHYERLLDVNFQNGARNEDGSEHGIIDSDLIEIVKHRLEAFQEGPYSSRENALVLTHLEEALMWMNRRVEDRIERNVLGKNKK